MDNRCNLEQNVSLQVGVNVPGIIAYHIAFMLVVTIPVTVVNIAIIIVLALEKNISKPIRIVLVNTPIACIIVAIGLFVNQVIALYGSTTGVDPPEAVCQFVVFCWGMGGAGRLAFMALYAVTVLLIVLVKASNLKSVFMFIAVAAVWLLVFLFILWYLIPLAFVIVYDKASCVPHPCGIEFTIVYTLVFGLFCLVVTIIIPFITLLYIKKHTLKEHSNIASGLAKFAFFLLVGNVINILSEIVPTIIAATISVSDTSGISMVVSSIVAISLIPSPIFIIAYFKDIRKMLFKPYIKIMK